MSTFLFFPQERTLLLDHHLHLKEFTVCVFDVPINYLTTVSLLGKHKDPSLPQVGLFIIKVHLQYVYVGWLDMSQRNLLNVCDKS